MILLYYIKLLKFHLDIIFSYKKLVISNSDENLHFILCNIHKGLPWLFVYNVHFFLIKILTRLGEVLNKSKCIYSSPPPSYRASPSKDHPSYLVQISDALM
jgi:hypothetical protein